MRSGFALGEFEHTGQPITIGGFNVPASHHLRYRSIEDHRRGVTAVEGIYRTTGPAFYARHERDPSTLMLSERSRLAFDLTRAAFLDIRAQVVEYNRTVQPVPNGPVDRVANAEAKTRVLLAIRTLARDYREGILTDDIDAASMRLCKLP